VQTLNQNCSKHHLKTVTEPTHTAELFELTYQLNFMVNYDSLVQGSQTHLGVRATLQDITQSVGRIVFRDDKMQ